MSQTRYCMTATAACVGLALVLGLTGCSKKPRPVTAQPAQIEERVESPPPVVTESTTVEPDGTRIRHRQEVETHYYHRREVKPGSVQTQKK